MSEKAVALLKGNMNELSHLVETYPHYIPVLAVAEFLHMKPAALRAAMEQNRCPFGFCWKLGERFSYKISTTALCAWLLGTAA